MASNQIARCPWTMSPEETAVYATLRQDMANAITITPSSSPPSAPPKNANASVSHDEASRLAQDVFAAMAAWDQSLALSLVESGAAVNAMRADGRSLVDIALELCGQKCDMHGLAVALLGRGAWVAPDRESKEFRAFFALAKKRQPIVGAALEASFILTRSAVLKNVGQWTHIQEMMALIAPRSSADSTLASLAAAGRFGILRQAAAAGLHIGEECMSAAAERLSFTNARLAKPTFFDASEAPDFIALLSLPSVASALRSKLASVFFSAAAWESNVGALTALLDAGLRPGEQWQGGLDAVQPSEMFDVKIVVQHSVPLLVLALASPHGREAFDALRRFPPALAAAKAHPPRPSGLACLTLAQLLEVRDLGIDIGVVDDVGSVAHWWARLDERPRDGWAALASKAPEIFDLKDSKGVRGAEKMAGKLRGDQKHAFLALLSCIESREIQKVAPAPKAASAAKPKARL